MYKCGTCRYFYDLFHFGEFCEYCKKNHCHLCMDDSDCNDYEEGDVPEGKERGGYC